MQWLQWAHCELGSCELTVLSHCDIAVIPYGEIFRWALCEYCVSSHLHWVGYCKRVGHSNPANYLNWTRSEQFTAQHVANWALLNKTGLYPRASLDFQWQLFVFYQWLIRQLAIRQRNPFIPLGNHLPYQLAHPVTQRHNFSSKFDSGQARNLVTSVFHVDLLPLLIKNGSA